MKKLLIIILIITFAPVLSFAKAKFVTTSHPIYAIIKEIVGETAELVRILPPSSSPHTYEPKPNDAKNAASANLVFYAANNLDGWINKLQNKNKVALFDLVPKEMVKQFIKSDGKNGGEDPHFWTDPLVVKVIATKLTEIIVKSDPAYKKVYYDNLNRFLISLDALHGELYKVLQPIAGKDVFLHHPSFIYFCSRYSLNYAGAIEEMPGKEPTPKSISELSKKVKSSKTKAIFNEPQLPAKPVEIIAKSAGVKMETLDPNGGVNGRFTYFELMKYNAYVLVNSLK